MNAKYRPDIDGLRALAILPVILFHADLGCPGGFVGVDIFFVISGFLITSLILKDIYDKTFSLITFWERRIRRIVPALTVVVLATLVAGWFLFMPVDYELLGKSVIAQVTLLSNVFFYRQGLVGGGYFATVSDTKTLLHTWSLAVEEQFYVFFPLLLLLASQKRFSIARSILYLGTGSLALSVAGSYYIPGATFYLLPTRAWELMIGAFLATIPERQLANSRANEAVGWAGLGLILYSIFFYTRETRFPGLAAIPPCLGAALIIFSGGSSSVKRTLISRGLAWKPVVFIGLISYSLYLWHWPLLVFSKYYNFYLYGKNPSWQLRITLLLVSVALAAVSLKWIETPFRKRWLCPRRPQMFALAGCATLTLLSFGVAIYLKHGIHSRLPSKADAFLAAKVDFAFRNNITPQQAAAGQFAELGAQSGNKPIAILLWGDSHAMHAAPALDELCRRFSVRGVAATHDATAPMLKYSQIVNNAGLNETAPIFSQSVVDFITQHRIKTVIISARWSLYRPTNMVAANLTETVQTIMASSATVFILKDVPRTDFDIPTRAGFTEMLHGDLDKLEISQVQYATLNADYEPIFNHLSEMIATILEPAKCFINTNEIGRAHV